MLVVCNACRYCEQYCPVFPAMERRVAFPAADLHYLANLCHNCGECLYACQYAPPHPFGVSLPRALARVRAESYQTYCWPPRLAEVFARQNAAAALGLSAAFSLVLYLGAVLLGGSPASPADFYAVVPHGVMVGLFGFVFVLAIAALVVSLRQYWRAIRVGMVGAASARAWMVALRDAATLRHLHGGGVDCTSAPGQRRPWRRWAHHATLGGFALCFASTTVAAIYHAFLGRVAPHAYSSLPVLLGAAGGVGLVVGPLVQLCMREARDPDLADAAQRPLDSTLLVLLLATSVTGLLLLALREGAWLRELLCVHLGTVLAFFAVMPYSKFVHGFYRLLALVNAHDESLRERDAR